MIFTTAWGCIRVNIRPKLRPIITSMTTVRPISTTRPALAGVKAQKPQSAGPKTAQRLGINRQGAGEGEVTEDGYRKSVYELGERKKLREQIVLANNNAQPVEAPKLTAATAVLESAVGSVFSFVDTDVSTLRTLEAFKRNQDWKFFYKPCTVIRRESLELGKIMEAIESAEIGNQESVVVDGMKGTGKSMLLLQCMAWALQKRWVVISISNAQNLVIGHTEYEYDTATELWAQPEYTAALLHRTNSANAGVLETLKLSRDYRLSGLEFSTGHPLSTLISAGARDSSIAYDVFRTLLDELSTPAINRPPVLFTLDNLNQISLTSAYHDSDFNPIHAHDLALPRIFLSFLNGSRKFDRGFIVAATSSQSPRTDALAYALRNEPFPDYSKLDTKVAPSVAGAKVMKLGAMQMDEASSLLEYCQNSGLLNETLDRGTIAQRFALSSGVAGEIVKGCVRIRA